MKNLFKIIERMLFGILLTVVLIACGASSDDSSVGSCDQPANLQTPVMDLSGGWYLEVITQGDDTNYYYVSYTQDSNYLDIYFQDMTSSNRGYLSGVISGQDIYWEFEDGNAVKFIIDSLAPDKNAMTMRYWDCSDGTSGTVHAAKNTK